MTVLSATPLPRAVLVGTCDGSGNVVINFEAPQHFYALCYIAVGASSGAPTFAVRLGRDQPLSYATGQQANIGPFLLNPGERAQLVVTGAAAGATIAGQLMGIQAPDPDGLVTALPVQSTAVIISGPVTVGGSVTITSGSVSISGTVSVAGSVAISSGTVSISGPVSISGTVNVSITGSNQVILGGGTASIGSISAVGSTVTVAGTVNIGNTPAVTISGTPTVNINSGTVSITGTPNINIQSQSVSVNTNQPQTNLGTVASGATGTLTLPAGTHAVGLIPPSAGPGRLRVLGGTSGRRYLDTVTPALQIPSEVLIVPVLSVYDNTLAISNLYGAGNLTVIAILDSEAVTVHSNPSDPVYVVGPPPTHVFINATLAAGASLILTPTAINVPHQLLRMSLSLDALAGNTMQLEDSTGGGYWGTVLAGPHQVDFGGVEGPVGGLSIRLHNYAAAGVTARGFLQYLPGT